ncbi:putative quinol monooxygenase [Saccharopolyspora sp. ASAGF58]|uniref:putative quinol monooxygenase n=1 Tax=Saccharopolyspora sp. ASAGF58 TaxID=2719023 RepID=UPI00143FC428|nr:antibiotic biosynthesis monooxygenase [Saccharopolyspora sp. ASAGF58]QIZ37790.1 hypothetical protein FDZ84_28450 [Saccharopolyspora sp. ASAGF58]
MIRSLLRLFAAPGERDALVSHYLRHNVVSASAPYGWRGGEVAVSRTDQDVVIVTSLWPDLAAYESWLLSAEREAVLDRISSLIDTARPSVTELFDVAQSASPAAAEVGL